MNSMHNLMTPLLSVSYGGHSIPEDEAVATARVLLSYGADKTLTRIGCDAEDQARTAGSSVLAALLRGSVAEQSGEVRRVEDEHYEAMRARLEEVIIMVAVQHLGEGQSRAAKGFALQVQAVFECVRPLEAGISARV